MSDTNAIVDWLRTKAQKILIPKTLISAVYGADGRRLDAVLAEQNQKIEEIGNTAEDKASSKHTHAFDDITNKPSTYPPSTHTHTFNNIEGKPDTYPPSSHTHSYKTLTDKPSTYPPSAHTHSFESITSKPSTYPPSAHTHSYGELKDVPTEFQPSKHTHSYNDLTDKPAFPVLKQGKMHISQTNDWQVSIDFGCTFKTRPVVTLSKNNLTGSEQGYIQVYDITTSGCTVVCDMTAATDSEFDLMWTAMGYLST